MKAPKNSWITDSEKTLIDSPFVKVIERDSHSSEDGRKHRFYVLRSRDWSNIIPVTADGKVVLVRQYRVGISEHTLEIPGGVVDTQDGDAQATAIREMTEETGYALLPGARCEKLFSPFANPAIMNNRCSSYVVGPVTRSCAQKLDPGEMIDVVEVPIAEIPKMIRDGEIDHALILFALLSLAFTSPEGESSLTRRLTDFTRS